MNKLEWSEIATIIVLTTTAWFCAAMFPLNIRIANFILLFSGLLLLQSLIRDVLILFIQRKTIHSTAPRIVRCMCFESTVGMTGVLLGIGIMGLGTSSTIEMGQIQWTLSFALITTTSFLIKDLVFQWNPWKIYKEKDHLNIVFSWKKPTV